MFAQSDFEFRRAELGEELTGRAGVGDEQHEEKQLLVLRHEGACPRRSRRRPGPTRLKPAPQGCATVRNMTLLHGVEGSVFGDKGYVSGEREEVFRAKCKVWRAMTKAAEARQLHPIDDCITGSSPVCRPGSSRSGC